MEVVSVERVCLLVNLWRIPSQLLPFEINWRLKEALIVSKSFPLSQISQKKRIGYKCIKYHIIVQKLSLTIFKTSHLRLINENLYKRTLFRISWTIIVTMATSIAKCCIKTKAFHTYLIKSLF